MNNIWPFTSIKICPKAYKLYQRELKTLPKTLNILPKIFKYLPEWWNFAKSGHTGHKPPPDQRMHSEWFYYWSATPGSLAVIFMCGSIYLSLSGKHPTHFHTKQTTFDLYTFIPFFIWNCTYFNAVVGRTLLVSIEFLKYLQPSIYNYLLLMTGFEP